jgi:uncharacterized protein (UPF0332 family)
LKTAELIARARRSATSAKLLFDAGDLNGACNRANSAMFDAARAALHASKEPVKSEVIKTHSGLIAAFSLYLIKPGRIPTQFDFKCGFVAGGGLDRDPPQLTIRTSGP